MKYVMLPAPVAIDLSFNYTFSAAVRYLVDGEEQFAKPVSRIRSGMRLLDALERAEKANKPYAVFSDDDYALLMQAFDNPTSGYGQFSRQVLDAEGKVARLDPIKVAPRLFIPFVDAMAAAQDKEPPPPEYEPALGVEVLSS